MDSAPLADIAMHARRARRLSWVSALLSTLLVVLALPSGTPRVLLAIFSFSCSAAWLNVRAQHRAVRANVAFHPGVE